MTRVNWILTAAALSVCIAWAGSVQAQFVKGNEAVRVLADGTKKVDAADQGGADGEAMPGHTGRLHPKRMANGRDSQRHRRVHRDVRAPGHLPGVDVRRREATAPVDRQDKRSMDAMPAP